jgi:hypothetical protein
MEFESIISKCLLTAVLMASLASCSSSKIAKDELSRLKNLQVASDMALIYIVRPSAVGSMLRMRVTCDGNSIGSTQGKQFIYAYVSPGKHEFVSKAENKDDLLIIVEAGKTYFLEQKAHLGYTVARNNLVRIIDEAEAREILKNCKLSNDCPAYVPVKK